INAFDHFDYEKIAEYGEEDIERLSNDAGIIRHKGKIKAAIANAQAFMKVQEEFGSFDAYIWSFVSGEQVVSQSDEERPTQSPLSDALTKHMKKLGYKFIVRDTIYSY